MPTLEEEKQCELLEEETDIKQKLQEKQCNLLEEETDIKQELQEKDEETAEQQTERKVERIPLPKSIREVTWADIVKHGTGTEKNSETEDCVSDTESDKALAAMLPSVVEIATELQPIQTLCDTAKVTENTTALSNSVFVPIADMTTDRYSLGYQLRCLAQKASEIEGKISSFNYRFSCSELSNWTLQSEITRLKDINAELKKELALQCFDVSLYKDLVSYQEQSRVTLNSQLVFVTAELMLFKQKFDEVSVANLELQQVVKSYKSRDLSWGNGYF
jgi:hypothetical protein